MQGLFDVLAVPRGGPPGNAVPALSRAASDLRPLLESLAQLDDALIASMQAAIDELGGDPGAPAPDDDLAATARTALSNLRTLAEAPADERPSLGAHDRNLVLVQLDSRRTLVTRQLAIEAWLKDWRAAQISPV